MVDILKNLDYIISMLGLLVPGIIILFVRSQFLVDRRLLNLATPMGYLSVSFVYYAIISPFVDLNKILYEHDGENIVVWFMLTFLGPVMLGLFLGINIQKNFLLRLLQRCGLNPVHAIPTAWDWKFWGMGEQWVLVTLKDDTRFAGFCGQDSFMSSDSAERDIYIESIYDIGDDNKWSSPGQKSVLIASGEVKTIEFWPYVPQEDANEQS